jgi:hypothetical protein
MNRNLCADALDSRFQFRPQILLRDKECSSIGLSELCVERFVILRRKPRKFGGVQRNLLDLGIQVKIETIADHVLDKDYFVDRVRHPVANSVCPFRCILVRGPIGGDALDDQQQSAPYDKLARRRRTTWISVPLLRDEQRNRHEEWQDIERQPRSCQTEHE